MFPYPSFLGFLFGFQPCPIGGQIESEPAQEHPIIAFFKGGSTNVKPPKAPAVYLPPAPTILAAPAAAPIQPVTEVKGDTTVAAAQDALRAQAAKRGVNATLLAGDTGGYQKPTQNRTLLG